jgi:hypothetical protein
MAAQTVFGASFRLSAQRGRWRALGEGTRACATWQPGAVLRAPGSNAPSYTGSSCAIWPRSGGSDGGPRSVVPLPGQVSRGRDGRSRRRRAGWRRGRRSDGCRWHRRRGDRLRGRYAGGRRRRWRQNLAGRGWHRARWHG